MRYPIILNPDERLHRTNRPVEMITDEVIDLLEGLRETMIAHDGIGIAAPQIGKNIQVAIVEVEEGEYLELINPEIIDTKGANRDVEGCLSIPHVYGVVERASEITVRYYDREGDEMEIQAFDYLARAIQHEIDHLHGILFTEKMIEQIPEDQLENYMEEHEND
ncbi:peptide deformylase [Enterococcus mediterraneensis]|uniref:peptide deformylase n=1 Tax=Enterococcus mediterraneensis TaxID=2364791 RepID=UPI000F057E84|nr:peptide deformylase [Enterococcus mediterraneensis]